jgi:hypothetical protein
MHAQSVVFDVAFTSLVNGGWTNIPIDRKYI